MIVLFASTNLYGQNSVTANSVAMESSAKMSSSHATYYIDPLPLHLNLILSPPPARGSATAAARARGIISYRGCTHTRADHSGPG